MAFVWCFFVVFVVSLCAAAVSGVSHCYACLHCDDASFNVSTAGKMECATNIITGPSTRNSNWDVLQAELRKQAHIYPADIDTEYLCATYSFSYSLNGEVATTRTCLSKRYGNLEACDYLKTILPTNYNLESCRTCDTDYCNSSSKLSASLFFLLITVSVVKHSF